MTMPVTIEDELLIEAGLSEHEVRVEIACRLFEVGKLTLPAATRWSGLSRSEFEGEALKRSIALYRPVPEDLANDLGVLDRLGV
jgi:predicted HTH domain antitoxin